MRPVVTALLPLLLVACGRIAFDPLTTSGSDGGSSSDVMATDAPMLPLCLADDFGDGNVSDWNVFGEWSAQSGGPDGSTMLHADSNTHVVGATHPMLAGITAASIAFDLRIEAGTTGDFYLHLLAPGWTDPSNDSKYRVSLHPTGSDNATDNIRRVNSPTNTTLATTATIIPAATWRRIDVAFGSDHSLVVTVDGMPHLMSPADSMLAGPYDIVFDFYRAGAIDNVQVNCTR